MAEHNQAVYPAPTIRLPNWIALRNAANHARFDQGLTIDRISDDSGLVRSTVVMLLTGTNDGGRLATWHAMAQGLHIDWATLAAALDDPDYDQPDILTRDDTTKPSHPH